MSKDSDVYALSPIASQSPGGFVFRGPPVMQSLERGPKLSLNLGFRLPELVEAKRQGWIVSAQAAAVVVSIMPGIPVMQALALIHLSLVCPVLWVGDFSIGNDQNTRSQPQQPLSTGQQPRHLPIPPSTVVLRLDIQRQRYDRFPRDARLPRRAGLSGCPGSPTA